MSSIATRAKPIAVIKVGGDMLLSEDDRHALAHNVQSLIAAGWDCILLHGGGPQLSELQAVHGLVSSKVAGRRITSLADLKVVKQALCGEVNVDLVAALIAYGVPAFGCHGASGGLIKAVKRPPIRISGEGDRLIDFGEVGDVSAINGEVLNALIAAGLVPTIASLGIDDAGRVFNINADTTVAAIAKEMRADLLILSTQIGGVFADIDDADSRIPVITPESAKQLIDAGVIRDGMIPKVEESLALLGQGVADIAICNATQKGSFLAVARQEANVGTRLQGK